VKRFLPPLTDHLRIRLLAALALLLHLASLMPIRLPDVPVFSSEAAAFPCAGKQCGCRTMQNCLTQCCCAKRLAGRSQTSASRPRVAAIPSPGRAPAVSVFEATSPVEQAKGPRAAGRWIVIIEARRCSGESSAAGAWNGFTALEPPALAVWTPDTAIFASISLVAPALSARSDAPPVPPPRPLA
jgi:hypothetical protein